MHHYLIAIYHRVFVNVPNCLSEGISTVDKICKYCYILCIDLPKQWFFVILALQGRRGKISILCKGLYTLYAEHQGLAFLFGTNQGVTEENWRWILIRLDVAELSRYILFNYILANLSLFVTNFISHFSGLKYGKINDSTISSHLYYEHWTEKSTAWCMRVLSFVIFITYVELRSAEEIAFKKIAKVL